MIIFCRLANLLNKLERIMIGSQFLDDNELLASMVLQIKSIIQIKIWLFNSVSVGLILIRCEMNI